MRQCILHWEEIITKILRIIICNGIPICNRYIGDRGEEKEEITVREVKNLNTGCLRKTFKDF